MQRIDITVKNYRCFDDRSPLYMSFGPGFTALLGPNNSGKSSALKLFHELRPILSALADPGLIQSFSLGNAHGLSAIGVEDPSEIFSNSNDRPLSVELSIPAPSSGQLARVVLFSERTAPNNWTARFFVGPSATPHVGQMLVASGPAASPDVVDTAWLQSFGKAIGNSLYVGPFRNAISEGSGTYYDLPIGTSFISLWDSWKTGPRKDQNDLALSVTQHLERLFGYERLEITAASDKKTLQAVVNGKPYRLRELGAGLAQFLVVLGSVAFRRPSLLLIDEPELNLHPALQATFLTTLGGYVSEGVLFATHSIGLARSTSEHLYSFHRTKAGVAVRPFAGTTCLPEFLGEMSFSGMREVGYDRVLLVEGASDVKTVREFLRKLGKDHTTVPLPLGGSQLINGHSEHELAEVKRLCTQVAVLIDSERTTPGEAISSERLAFLEVCQRLGIVAHATELRATENYLPERAIRAVKGPSYRALGPHETLASAPLGWAKSDNWRIAAAMTNEELLATDVGAFLARL